MAVDEETKKHLESVKKGKPRRFVMICKGINILSLIVYKKGSLETFKKQAKAEGRGQFYHGVVDGKGQDIVFKLLRSDGFEKPPGKTRTLKSFLKDEAELQFKPLYEIVDSLPEVLEDDGDDPSPESQSTLGSQDAGRAELFKARLTELIPQIKQAAGTLPGDEAKLKASQASLFARQQKFPEANAMLDAAQQLLQAAAPAASADDPAERFKARLAALIPQIKQTAETVAGEEAKLKASQAGVFARKLDFEQANLLLEQAEKLLGEGSASSPSDGPQLDELENQAQALKTAIYPLVKEAIATNPQAKDELVRLLGLARKHEQAGEFGQVIEIMAQLSELVGQTSTSPARSDAEIAGCIRRWEAGLRQVSTEIDLLEESVRDDLDTDADAAADALRSIVAGFDKDLESALAAVDEGAPAQAALQIVNTYESYIIGSELIRHAETNPYGVTVDIREPLMQILTEIRGAL